MKTKNKKNKIDIEYRHKNLLYGFLAFLFWVGFILFYIILPTAYLVVYYLIPAGLAAKITGTVALVVFIAVLVFAKQLKEAIHKLPPSVFKSILYALKKLLPFLIGGALLYIVQLDNSRYLLVLENIMIKCFILCAIGALLYIFHDVYHNKRMKLIAQHATTVAVRANNDTLLTELDNRNAELLEKMYKMFAPLK